MSNKFDEEMLGFFQEITEDKYFSTNITISELQKKGLSILYDKGVLVSGDLASEEDAKNNYKRNLNLHPDELDLNYFVFFNDLDYDNYTLESLLNLTRLIINDVSSIRIRHPSVIISTESIWKTHRTIQIIADNIKKCYDKMKQDGDRDEFNDIYNKFMTSELKLDRAHIIAGLKRKKELLFQQKSEGIMMKYCKVYDEIVLLTADKETQEKDNQTILGGVKTIFFGEPEDINNRMQVLFSDLDFLKNMYYKIYTEKKDVVNDEISPKLRENIKSTNFISEIYIEHYVRIITQTI